MVQLDAFASAQQMRDRTGGAIPADRPFLDSELAAASRLIRNFCGWHIAPQLELTFTRRGDYRDGVWLPAMEVAAITAVTVDGVEWSDLSTVDFDPDTGWTNLHGRKVTVGYTAGFEATPEDIVTATLQVAARALGSPLGAVREQTLASSVQWSSTAAGVAGGAVLLDVEKDALAQYRIGRIP